MRKTLIAITSLMICIALFAGCQPTPDKSAVVQKNDGKLEEKLAQSPVAAYKYEAPSHWKETYKRDKLTVEFDADITLPAVDKYPVVKVEPMLFTQEKVDELVNYFAAGKKLYRFPAVKTKADYAAEIVLAKRGQEVDDQYVVTGESESWVKELEQKMPDAPETYEREYVGTALGYERDFESGKESPEYGKNFLSVAVDTGATEDPTIYCCNYVQNRGRNTSFFFSKPFESGRPESDMLWEDISFMEGHPG